MIDPRNFEALIFDTGGTVFDWHTAVKTSLESVGSARGLDADWGAVTKAWRRRSTTRWVMSGRA